MFRYMSRCTLCACDQCAKSNPNIQVDIQHTAFKRR